MLSRILLLELRVGQTNAELKEIAPYHLPCLALAAFSVENVQHR